MLLDSIRTEIDSFNSQNKQQNDSSALKNHASIAQGGIKSSQRNANSRTNMHRPDYPKVQMGQVSGQGNVVAAPGAAAGPNRRNMQQQLPPA